ncbi:MAG: hypothetical protein ACP5HG_09965 [Anaerolineae bacterium]
MEQQPASQPLLTAETDIEVSLDQARAWFLSLADHPERYQFATHAGFTFTQGRFGEPGARFETEERFHGIRLTLKFELIDVEETRFVFHVLEPVTDIWGYFDLTPVDSESTRLCLGVGSDVKAKRLLLRAPLVRGAVHGQISREVDHIKRSMESLYQEETWAS